MKFVYLLTLLTSLRDAFFVLGDRTGGASYGTLSSSEPSVERKITRCKNISETAVSAQKNQQIPLEKNIE